MDKHGLNPKRKWFLIHRSTAVVLTVVSAGMLRISSYERLVPFNDNATETGWPLTYSKFYGLYDPPTLQNFYGPEFLYDIGIALLIVAVLGIASEFIARRRNIHLCPSTGIVSALLGSLLAWIWASKVLLNIQVASRPYPWIPFFLSIFGAIAIVAMTESFAQTKWNISFWPRLMFEVVCGALVIGNMIIYGYPLEYANQYYPYPMKLTSYNVGLDAIFLLFCALGAAWLTARMQRSWLQFRLSTAMAMTVATSWVLWANVAEQIDKNSEHFCYRGWPYSFLMQIEYPVRWTFYNIDRRGAVNDVAIAILILAVVCVSSEFLVRRR